jgi:hypothetical protein
MGSSLRWHNAKRGGLAANPHSAYLLSLLKLGISSDEFWNRICTRLPTFRFGVRTLSDSILPFVVGPNGIRRN